jgi:predicted dehydrogenase
METVRWGIVGCGDVTEVKSGPALQKAAGSQLVAVMRRNAAKAEDYARRHRVPRWYADADGLINDPEVNAVYVATPPDTHAEYTLRAARAGKPVYVEKPMARTHAECQRMIEACRQEGVPLFVAYYRRALPSFLKVKELVQEGAIGQVRCARLTLLQPLREKEGQVLPWRVVPEISGGGYFFDLAAHQLDYLDYLFGPIDSVSGRAVNQAGRYSAEDLVCAHFHFASGVLGSGIWCFTLGEGQQQDRIEIEGSRGRIAFSTFAFTPVLLEREKGVEEFPFPRPEHVQQPLIQTVVNALLGKGECPSTGESGARTSRVMDQIVAGFYGH